MYPNTTTFAYKYWDGMDGDAMVCSPNGPSGYRTMCSFNQYVLGSVLFICALSLFYNASRLGRLTSTILPDSRHQSTRTSEGSKRNTAGSQAQLLYFTRYAYALGFQGMAMAGSHLIGGNGTVYSTSTISGLLSDFVYAIGVACVLYHSLLQLRGAKAFRKMLQLPTQSNNPAMRVKSFTHVLDMAQGVGAFPITFGVWVLLSCGVIKRSYCYGIYYTLTGFAGVRSMLENILDRGRTLARINNIQQNAGGDPEVRNRRNATLRLKAHTLLFHMFQLLFAHIFFAFSMIIFKSVNSSTQMLLHNGSWSTAAVLLTVAHCKVTNEHVNKSYERQEKLTNQETQKGSPKGRTDEFGSVFTVANVSGMSVVGDSLNL